MPAIWSSSERPMSVRTVWVDGVRHAILSSDDPARVLHPRARIHSAKSSVASEAYPGLNLRRRADSFDEGDTHESLDDCFVNVRVAVKERVERANERRIARRQSAPSQCNRLAAIESDSPNFIELRLDRGSNYDVDHTIHRERQSTRRRGRNYTRESNDSYGWNKTIDETSKDHQAECDENCDEAKPEVHSNLLSERVLQWIDLSGRSSNFCLNKNGSNETRTNLSRPKPTRRDCNEMSMKEQVVPRTYKIDTEDKTEASSSRRSGLNRQKSKDRFERIANDRQSPGIGESKENCTEARLHSKEEFRGKNSTRNKDSALVAIGRPQLHIFMPDLNSSSDDTSSEDSFKD